MLLLSLFMFCFGRKIDTDGGGLMGQLLDSYTRLAVCVCAVYAFSAFQCIVSRKQKERCFSSIVFLSLEIRQQTIVIEASLVQDNSR